MIIRHNPPRKTPDLYSDDLYDGICVGLGVQDEQQKIYFKETIERAALSLIKAWKENPQKFTDSEEKYELKRLAKSLKKSRTVLDDLCNKAHLGQFRLFGGFNLNKSEKQLTNNSILKEVFGKYHNNTQAISRALEALEETALDAIQGRCMFEREDSRTPMVLRWIWDFSDDWEEISEVKFAKGNDYDSPSLRILQIMAGPINKEILGREPLEEELLPVSNSMLEQAVIRYNKYKEEHPEDTVGCD